jgi:hypothetical protein
VAYESENRLTNEGRQAWTREQGLPSIWILGMFTPGPHATTVVPLKRLPEGARSEVRMDYFGPIGSDRLRVIGPTAFFRSDGESRGKLGVPPALAKPIAGSWDADRGVLTIIQYGLPPDAENRPYVDSRWADTNEPYAGDVFNAYNDGPPAAGAAPLGPFYEIESSSPAAELPPGASITHWNRTIHLQGPRESLTRVAQAVLGVSLSAIEGAFLP